MNVVENRPQNKARGARSGEITELADPLETPPDADADDTAIWRLARAMFRFAKKHG